MAIKIPYKVNLISKRGRFQISSAILHFKLLNVKNKLIELSLVMNLLMALFELQVCVPLPFPVLSLEGPVPAVAVEPFPNCQSKSSSLTLSSPQLSWSKLQRVALEII